MNLTSVDEVFYSESVMLPKRDELSPDLEWMLLSDQVDDDALIEALVQRYYPRIYREGLSQLTSPELAQRAAQDTIVQAIIESKNFRGDMPLSEWLDGIASRIFKERNSALQGQQLHNPKLIHSIKIHKSDPQSPIELELAIQGIKTRLHSRKSSNSRRISAQVLGLLGVVTLVILIMIGGSGYLSQEENAGDPSAENDPKSDDTVTRQQGTPQDLHPQSTAPLTLASTDDEIRQRIGSSNLYWDTMWAEIVVTFHGPDGYLGPPKKERHQFWIDPQHGGMLVSGPLDGFPSFIERFDLPTIMENYDPRRIQGEIITQIGSQLPWFVLNIETVLNLPFVLNYLAESTLPEIIQFDRYLPVGEQFWAGYQALIIDLISDTGFPAGRILLEPGTGIVLREQYYVPGSKNVFIESNIQELKFNQPMPTLWKRPDNVLRSPRVFLPGNIPEIDQSNSWSNPALPDTITGAIVPVNFDPSRSYLNFFDSGISQAQESGFERFEIYADNFHLGEIELPDPLQMICARSPSGKRLAFAKWTYFPDGESSRVYWFDLDELQISSYQLPEIALQWIEFAPDNRTLGISGFSEAEGQNLFFLLDTERGTNRTLPIKANFNRITWSPDGNRILVLEEFGSSFDPETERIINIYSADDGQLLDQIEVEDANDQIIFDGGLVEFKLGIQDISSCAAPPRTAISELP
jgi:hypothetical protein